MNNQPPPLQDYNVFATDRALLDALSRVAPDIDRAELHELGALSGAPQSIELGFEANRNTPELLTHDRFGERIDEVRFHPAYHALMNVATAHGLHAAPWLDKAPHAHLRRAAKFFVWSQVEGGHLCPISMTYAAVPALEHAPLLAPHWVGKLAARGYDARLAPIAQKESALCGMGMTEKQGGSDVRANTTRAERIGDGEYVLEGHKWFCSAPMSDAFLVLAQSDRGLSCFLVPRVLADGSRNSFAIARLKDKLGNRSNASSEVEFHATHAWIVGDPGRGIQTIVEMVNGTRLDCIIGSAALLRGALAQAVHHATYRRAFGAPLVDHALMQNVLADLALESEAATALFVRLAHAADQAPHDAHAAALRRIGTAVGKYYVCKRAPAAVAEALECLGGNGYVEESIMPRYYREAPLNSIWEGSGNINALDVLRVLQKQPEALEALYAELEPALRDTRVASAARDLRAEVADEDVEWRARALVERMALLWQASLLLQSAPNYVSDCFIASRLSPGGGRTLGTLPIKTALRGIVDRASPSHEAAAI
ncbi:MAG TPA: acyl-CoA dehydrogenase family protein [Candidatus Acidoferrales bacterium]|nr:acyl-CoA dehydrogenase family protein [Candidatus Acidoferrales bacterium]